MKNLDLAENGEVLNGFVVIGNEIDHLVSVLSQLLSVHGPQCTFFHLQTISNTARNNATNTFQ